VVARRFRVQLWDKLFFVCVGEAGSNGKEGGKKKGDPATVHAAYWGLPSTPACFLKKIREKKTSP